METSVVFVYDTTDGRLMGIVEPDKDLVGGVGWIDIAAGVAPSSGKAARSCSWSRTVGPRSR